MTSIRLACQMGVYCEEHNFIHGAEAEELRKQVELLIADASQRDRNVGVWELQQLLDECDARDSVAFLEIMKKHEKADEEYARARGLIPKRKAKGKK